MKLCMELVLDSSLSKEGQMAKIEALIPMMAHLELENDLKGLLSLLSAPKKSSSLERVELCKGWEDLLLSGTEVVGSCQRIDGDPNLNKCLLAYCLDGKNSMLAVKTSEGKILARSIFRLLWNKIDFKPALFLDRLYSNRNCQEIEESIRTGAKECAKELGLDLYTSYGEGFFSEVRLESLGSSCPYEYADSADLSALGARVMPKGVFAINNALKLSLD